MTKKNIAIIGTGTMGGGIARALSKEHHLFLCDHDRKKAEELAGKIGAMACSGAASAVQDADYIFLAVKPQDLSSAAKELFGKVREEQTLVSILAGATTKTLQKYFGDATILRMMPNVACFYGKGVAALVDGGGFTSKQKEEYERDFSVFGHVHWFPENRIDAVTAITGSGPAFAYMMIESIAEAGIALGLSAGTSKEMAIQMFQGALTTLQETGKHPGELKWEVTSPGGSTIAGIVQMEDESVRSGIINTFLASYQRVRELAEAS